MTPEERQDFANLVLSDDAVANQVFKVMRALTLAQANGQAIISPASKDHPIVLISYSDELKKTVTAMLAQHGQKPSWED